MKQIKIRKINKLINYVDKAYNLSEVSRDIMSSPYGTSSSNKERSLVQDSKDLIETVSLYAYNHSQNKNHQSSRINQSTVPNVSSTVNDKVKSVYLHDVNARASDIQVNHAYTKRASAHPAADDYSLLHKSHNKIETIKPQVDKRIKLRYSDNSKNQIKIHDSSRLNSDIKLATKSVGRKKAVDSNHRFRVTSGKISKIKITTSQYKLKATVMAAANKAKSEYIIKANMSALKKAALAFANAAKKTYMAIAAAAKSLWALICLLGVAGVTILLGGVVVAAILCSALGVLFADEAEPGALKAVVSQLNDEYKEHLEKIEENNPADIVEYVADDNKPYINWRDVLSIYSVLTVTKENTDSITIDDIKIKRISDLMWEMNEVSYSKKTTNKTITSIEENEDGEEVEVEKTITETTLTIKIEHRSCDEMAAYYSFDKDQLEQLELLNDSEWEPYWNAIIGVFEIGDGDIIISEMVGQLSYPVPYSGNISSYFGYRGDPFTGNSKFHGALDIMGPIGTPILAAADGTVTIANASDSWGGGYGYYVNIDHGNGLQSRYGHCSKINVTVGQQVKKGQVIAGMGSTGKSTGSHVHWEIYVNGSRVDPLSFF